MHLVLLTGLLIPNGRHLCHQVLISQLLLDYTMAKMCEIVFRKKHNLLQHLQLLVFHLGLVHFPTMTSSSILGILSCLLKVHYLQLVVTYLVRIMVETWSFFFLGMEI